MSEHTRGSMMWAAALLAVLACCPIGLPLIAAENSEQAREVVAFSRTEEGISKVCILDLGSGEMKVLCSSKDDEFNEPVVCMPGGFVVFVSPDNRLHRIGMDGKDHRVLASFPKGDRLLSVDVSRDGRQAIVALCACTENPKADGLHLVDLQSGKAVQLTSDDCYRPRFSPDGKWAAFESSRDGHYQIFAMDLAAKRLTKLSVNGEGVCYGACWSPDGKQVAFCNSESELFVADVSSGKGRRVAKLAPGTRAYAFSPNGRQLAFKAADAISVVSSAGGTPVQVTKASTDVRMIRWSSDGKSLIFDQRAAEDRQLKGFNSVEVSATAAQTPKEWSLKLAALLSEISGEEYSLSVPASSAWPPDKLKSLAADQKTEVIGLLQACRSQLRPYDLKTVYGIGPTTTGPYSVPPPLAPIYVSKGKERTSAITVLTKDHVWIPPLGVLEDPKMAARLIHVVRGEEVKGK